MGELIDLWNVSPSKVRDPEHLLRIKGFIPFTRATTDDKDAELEQ